MTGNLTEEVYRLMEAALINLTKGCMSEHSTKFNLMQATIVKKKKSDRIHKYKNLCN